MRDAALVQGQRYTGTHADCACLFSWVPFKKPMATQAELEMWERSTLRKAVEKAAINRGSRDKPPGQRKCCDLTMWLEEHFSSHLRGQTNRLSWRLAWYGREQPAPPPFPSFFFFFICVPKERRPESSIISSHLIVTCYSDSTCSCLLWRQL